MPKQSKSQATSPEVQKTDAEAMMGEVHPQADTKKMEKMKEGNGLEQFKTGMKIQKKGKPGETFTVQMVQPSNVKGMEASMALHLKDDKTGKEFRDSPGGYEAASQNEMEMNVAEEGTLNEIDPGTIDWSVVAAGLGAIGLTPFLIDKIHDLWKKKFPKSFEKAQSLSRNIDKQASGNEPGDKDRQIKTGQFESTNLKELFGLGAKGAFKPGQRVKHKGQEGWIVDKFLGKKGGFEKYSIRDASGSGKHLEVTGNEISA
jgi:hypothetical protein